MGTFIAADAVERIEWNFEDTPHVEASRPQHDGESDEAYAARPMLVEGEHVTGVLPEPSPARAAAFLESYERFLEENIRAARESYARERVLDRRAGGMIEPDDDGADVPDVIGAADLYGLVCSIGHEALVGVGVPESLVVQLPPRVLLRFLRHVAKELSGEDDAASSIA